MLDRPTYHRHYYNTQLHKYNQAIDHIVSLNRNGIDDAGNKVISCRNFNQSKADKLPEEWKTWLESRERNKNNTTEKERVRTILQNINPLLDANQ